jgi:hypothetical protein
MRAMLLGRSIKIFDLLFTSWDQKENGFLIPKVITSLQGLRYAWIEFKVAHYDWTLLVEISANNQLQLLREIGEGIEVTRPDIDVSGLIHTLFGQGSSVFSLKKGKVPHPLEGSTIHQVGEDLAEMALRKGQKYPLIVEIHGIASGNIASLQHLSTAFSSVKNEYDYLLPIDYHTPKMMRWLRTRAFADPTIELQVYAQSGCLGGEFVRERELIPAICITPEELPVFVHLHIEYGLQLQWTRSQPLPSLPGQEKKKGILLGKA